MRVFASLVLFTTVLLAGCKSMESNPYDVSNSLNYNAPLNLPGKASGLWVSLLSLQDTRCPQNVICIQPGKVDLLLMVKTQTDSVKIEAAYYNEAETNKPKSFKLGSNQYQLSILRVLPLPMEGVKLNISDYTVSLDIASL